MAIRGVVRGGRGGHHGQRGHPIHGCWIDNRPLGLLDGSLELSLSRCWRLEPTGGGCRCWRYRQWDNHRNRRHRGVEGDPSMTPSAGCDTARVLTICPKPASGDIEMAVETSLDENIFYNPGEESFLFKELACSGWL